MAWGCEAGDNARLRISECTAECPAVDQQILPGDVAGLIRCQEKGQCGDFGGGAEPADWLAADEIDELVPAFKVDVVDTTAAGDAFSAGLAVGLAEGRALREAARLGNGAGALAATILGASPSMPQRATLDRFLAERA